MRCMAEDADACFSEGRDLPPGRTGSRGKVVHRVYDADRLDGSRKKHDQRQDEKQHQLSAPDQQTRGKRGSVSLRYIREYGI